MPAFLSRLCGDDWRRTPPAHVLPIWVLVLSLVLAGCLPQAARVELAPNEKLVITPAVWQSYLEYRAKMGSIDGAFVVAESGDVAAYSLCPSYNCRPYNYTRRAIDLCDDAGIRCVLFAKGWDILVDFEIVE